MKNHTDSSAANNRIKASKRLAIAVILIGIIVNQWTVGFFLTDDGTIESTFNKALILLFQVAAILTGALLLYCSKRHGVGAAASFCINNGYKLLIGVLLIELVFGGWFNHQHRLRNLLIFRNIKLTKDCAGLYANAGLITYTRDGYGLRGEYPAPDRIDILTVGGSTTDQSTITDEETWQNWMQLEHSSHGGELVVVNAGKNGHGTLDHIKAFEDWFAQIPNLKPRYVLFLIGENDLTDPLPKSAIITKIKINSFFYYYINQLYRKVKKSAGVSLDKPISPDDKLWTTKNIIDESQYGRVMVAHLEGLKNRISTLVALTCRLGAKPIFVTQPTRKWRFTNNQVEGVQDTMYFQGIPYNGVDKYFMMQRQNRIMQETAVERGAFFLNAGEAPNWEDSDFIDLIHFTPSGCKKFGAMLSDSLLPLLSSSE